jgi:hypothetical protein
MSTRSWLHTKPGRRHRVRKNWQLSPLAAFPSCIWKNLNWTQLWLINYSCCAIIIEPAMRVIWNSLMFEFINHIDEEKREWNWKCADFPLELAFKCQHSNSRRLGFHLKANLENSALLTQWQCSLFGKMRWDELGLYKTQNSKLLAMTWAEWAKHLSIWMRGDGGESSMIVHGALQMCKFWGRSFVKHVLDSFYFDMLRQLVKAPRENSEPDPVVGDCRWTEFSQTL